MNKILLAYDGTYEAGIALGRAAEMARLTGAVLGVVSVVPFRPGRGGGVDPWDDRSVHARQLEEACAALRTEGIEPEVFMPVGDPAGQIDRVAREGGFDTVVIGTRDLSPIDRILQGSVSQAVATGTTATVVVARGAPLSPRRIEPKTMLDARGRAEQDEPR